MTKYLLIIMSIVIVGYHPSYGADKPPIQIDMERRMGMTLEDMKEALKFAAKKKEAVNTPTKDCVKNYEAFLKTASTLSPKERVKKGRAVEEDFNTYRKKKFTIWKAGAAYDAALTKQKKYKGTNKKEKEQLAKVVAERKKTYEAYKKSGGVASASSSSVNKPLIQIDMERRMGMTLEDMKEALKFAAKKKEAVNTPTKDCVKNYEAFLKTASTLSPKERVKKGRAIEEDFNTYRKKKFTIWKAGAAYDAALTKQKKYKGTNKKEKEQLAKVVAERKKTYEAYKKSGGVVATSNSSENTDVLKQSLDIQAAEHKGLADGFTSCLQTYDGSMDSDI